MLFRPYQPDDFAQLYALEESCFPPALRFSRGYMRQLVNRVKAATWVAEDDGQLAGFASAGWASRRDNTVAYIETIEVSPLRRGKGIGGELLRLVEASALMAQADSIWLHVDARNQGAIRLYRTHGYRCEGSKEEFYPDGNPALIFRKQL